MLASAMAMRLRKTHGSSQSLRPRRSLNGFRFAHDHAGRLSRSGMRERPNDPNDLHSG